MMNGLIIMLLLTTRNNFEVQLVIMSHINLCDLTVKDKMIKYNRDQVMGAVCDPKDKKAVYLSKLSSDS